MRNSIARVVADYNTRTHTCEYQQAATAVALVHESRSERRCSS